MSALPMVAEATARRESTLRPEIAFADAIAAAGIEPPDCIVADGQLHRFSSNGKRGDDAGYYNLHLDGIPAGHFGCWRTGAKGTWHADIGRKLSFAESAALARRRAEAEREREADKMKRHAEGRERANAMWQAAGPASPEHPYLAAKGVQAHGVREHHGVLLIPMLDADGTLHSLQTIAADGTKLFLKGGRVRGCHYIIGDIGETLLIAEGFATAATLHEVTGHPVAVAFNAGNLVIVARALRESLPKVSMILCADDDIVTEGNPGKARATEAADAIGGFVAIPDFGNDRPKDATDFNDAYRHAGAEAVKRAVARAKSPEASEGQPNPPDAAEADSERDAWPDAMDEAAHRGIVGEFVRMVGPNTEADPAAITVQFLVAFGALVGRGPNGPYYGVEGDRHHANLYGILVGATAKGRKGTSWGRVRQVYERCSGWKPHVSGLSSGEGLKFNVRDAREETKPNKKGELVTEQVDAGIDDKRLLVFESEFASALRGAQRQGNTLSAAVRESWDSGNLRTLTKNDPVTATGAHVCIVGHITADELRAELTATDSANGFANRFLFIAVKRSQMIPFGGDEADEAEIQAFAYRLQERADLARTRQRIGMTEGAKSIWRKVYPELSAGGEGLHGAVTARAEAQVIRLALVYALLDGADQIDAPHLLAALSVWTYCDSTAKYVFGSSLGDRNADEIMRRLRLAGPDGMSRTDIRDMFGRHLSADRIGAALDLLKRKGTVTVESVSTGGRPTEVWRATK